MQRVLSTSLMRISNQAMSEGALAIFLYWKLAERGIDCDILAPSTVQRSAKNKGVKNDRRDSRNVTITAIERELSCFVWEIKTGHLD